MILTNKIRLAVLVICCYFYDLVILFIDRASFLAIDGQRYYSLFDDAMISMRYAWNFAHGEGLVWNPGERVEGYTNLLMVLVMAIPNLFLEKRLAVLVVQILGGIFLLISAFLILKFAFLDEEDGNPELAQLIATLSFISVLFYYPLAFWSLMGMETSLVALLIFGGLLAYLDYSKKGYVYFLIVLPVLLGLAYLARPNSLVFALVILFIGMMINTIRGEGFYAGFRRVIVPLGIFVLFPLGQLLFRYLYYGEFVPNTYILKVVGIPLGVRSVVELILLPHSCYRLD